MKKYVLFLILCLPLAGCELIEIIDPNTGQESSVVVLDSEKADQAEVVADAVVTTTGAASLVWPVLTPIAALMAGVLGSWRKMRPKLEEATKTADVSYKAGEILCEALEEVKLKHPSVWNDIKPTLEKIGKTATEVENAVAGFRHKNPV